MAHQTRSKKFNRIIKYIRYSKMKGWKGSLVSRIGGLTVADISIEQENAGIKNKMTKFGG